MQSLLGTARCFSSLRIRNTATNSLSKVTLRMCSVAAEKSSCPINDIESDKTVKPFEEIPGPTGIYNIPYIGFLFHLKPFTKYTTGTIHLLFNELVEKYGPIFRIRLNAPVVVISDPKEIAVMMRHEGKYPTRPNFEIFDVYYKRTNTPPNLANIQGEEWWKLRGPTQRAMMRPKQLSQYLPMMNKVADDFVQKVKRDTHFKAEEAFMSYFAETAGTVFFNKRLGFLDEKLSEEARKMLKATSIVFEKMYTTTVGSSNGFRFYRSKDYRMFEASADHLIGLSARNVKEFIDKIDHCKKNGLVISDEPNMLLSLLKDVTEQEAALIIDGLYAAAIDTSSSGLQIFLHTLAKHPDKQEILRQEIHTVLGKDDNDVTQEHLDRMPYLKACLKETYRLRILFPYGPGRIMPSDVVLGGYSIPAGVHVFMYTAKACHDENVFDNPYDFVPERWLRENKGQDRDVKNSQNSKVDSDSSWALLPFGLGPRGCPGRRLFEQELFLIVAKLLRKMKVGLAEESLNTEFEYRLLLKPVKPLKFTFKSVDIENNSS